MHKNQHSKRTNRTSMQRTHKRASKTQHQRKIQQKKTSQHQPNRFFSSNPSLNIEQFLREKTGDSAFNIQTDKAFTVNHEWFKVTGSNEISVGITKYAAAELDTLLHVELTSEALDGNVIAPGEPVASLDSSKGFAQVYAPLSLKLKEFITSDPDQLDANPNELAIFSANIVDSEDNLDVKLLTSTQYQQLLKDNHNVEPADYGL